MNAETIYGHIKDLLARLTGWQRKEIKADLELIKHLRFTVQGTRDLAQKLNDHFHKIGKPLPSPGVHPDETALCVKVRDVSKLMRKKFKI